VPGPASFSCAYDGAATHASAAMNNASHDFMMSTSERHRSKQRAPDHMML